MSCLSTCAPHANYHDKGCSQRDDRYAEAARTVAERLNRQAKAAALRTSEVIRKLCAALDDGNETNPEVLTLAAEGRTRAALLEGCVQEAKHPQSNAPLFDSALVAVLTMIGEVRS